MTLEELKKQRDELYNENLRLWKENHGWKESNLYLRDLAERQAKEVRTLLGLLRKLKCCKDKQ